MRNINWPLITLSNWTASKRELKSLPKRLILGLTLVVALLSWGCPKQDPLRAFNPPPPVGPGPAPVPEPATALLFGTALLIAGAVARRRNHSEHH